MAAMHGLWWKTPRRSTRLPSGGGVSCAVTACKSDAKRRRPRFGRYITCDTVHTLTNYFGDRSARFAFWLWASREMRGRITNRATDD